MPVEIRELIIKASITDTAGTAPDGKGTGGGGMNEDALQRVIDQVMEKIKSKNER